MDERERDYIDANEISAFEDSDYCGSCDCADEAPRDPDDPGAYPGPDEDCECLCHHLEDAAAVEATGSDDEALIDRLGLDPGQVC